MIPRCPVCRMEIETLGLEEGESVECPLCTTVLIFDPEESNFSFKIGDVPQETA